MSVYFKYATASEMMRLIDEYFLFVKGESPSTDTETGIVKPGKARVKTSEVPTIRGLTLFLNFKSVEDLEKREKHPKYRKALRYARLRIEAAQEQQLFDKPTGAIFALKAMGWKEKPDAPLAGNTKTLKVEITNAGPTPAGNEKDVDLLI